MVRIVLGLLAVLNGHEAAGLTGIAVAARGLSQVNRSPSITKANPRPEDPEPCQIVPTL